MPIFPFCHICIYALQVMISMAENTWICYFFQTHFGIFTDLLFGTKMPKSKLEIEAEREYVTDRINMCCLRASDKKKRYTDYDRLTLNWMLRLNIRKLINLPLPEISVILQSQIDICQKLETFVDDELADSLLDHLDHLRRKLVEINSSH